MNDSMTNDEAIAADYEERSAWFLKLLRLAKKNPGQKGNWFAANTLAHVWPPCPRKPERTGSGCVAFAPGTRPDGSLPPPPSRQLARTQLTQLCGWLDACNVLGFAGRAFPLLPLTIRDAFTYANSAGTWSTHSALDWIHDAGFRQWQIGRSRLVRQLLKRFAEVNAEHKA